MLESSEIDLKGRFYPEIYNPSIKESWETILDLKMHPFLTVVDEIDSQVADLIKADNPERSFSKIELDLEVRKYLPLSEKDFIGNWIFYPWKNTLVHVLPKEDFIRIRTLRNNFKITPEEQQELGKKKVGIVGLSVGQSVALAISLERGCGELRLADFDTLELSNLNRLKAGVTSLGLEKVVIAAREISEIDPYLNIKVYREGINQSNIHDFLTSGGHLDLLIDECDSLDIKLLLREEAKKEKIPVLMETSDRGMLDIERFDLEPNRPSFHGLLDGVKPEDLKNLSNKEKVSIVLKITGLETLSLRMKTSLLEIGQTITSWPQLASGVFLGGASVAHVSRKLLLGSNVDSGRYYIDFDDILKIDSPLEEIIKPNYQAISDFQEEIISQIPSNILQSAYFLSKEELKEIVEKANLAPSGGNVQPWIWVFDKKGVLHLIHDSKRSHSMLDYKGTGSLIAFGAALENLRLASAKIGIETEFISHINNFGDELIASIRFISKFKKPVDVPYLDLAEGISLRCTNRKNGERIFLTPEEIAVLENLAIVGGLNLKFSEDESDLENLAKVVGGMDRMRLFHDQGIADFIKEVRWSEKEAIESRDGIDIATLELSGTEKAAMGLLKDPRTVKFFRKFLMGYGLTKISKDTLLTASGVALLQGGEFDPKSYLNAGKVLQRIWIKANCMGISFQPVTAMLFIFNLVERESKSGFSSKEEQEIKKLKNDFNSIFKNKENEQNLFLFRLNKMGEPSVRALRRPVEETLIVL
ncbi:ThiF family protein [Algoriphagus boseongensis]|uniref:ThiF family protein n=1 Tax=Algoriphagus boseongensis TaxID=1442587 RepID=A0A4V3D1S4_9BACT|nr:Rv1355c family protein [Algoriphagus boseongensis]TDQ13526.1 ThiF family protein [Algoriphagus boseongensis]